MSAGGEGGSARPTSIRDTVRSALAWTSGLRIITRLAAIVTTISIARLVAPEEYGVYATIVIAHQALATASDMSLDAAIIQTRRDPRPALDTVWTVGVARGVVLAVLLFAVAPAYAEAFRIPEAVPMLRTLALAPLLLGVHSVGPILLRRELRYGPIFALHAAETLSFAAVAIALAWLLHSAWALVIALVASSAVRVIVSYAVHPARARPGFDGRLLQELFRFSRWTTLYGVLDLILETFDNAVVARFIGPTALAFYRIAYQLASEGSQSMQWIVTAVAFPAVARIQAESARVRAGFRAMLAGTSVALFPLGAALMIVGPGIVPLVFGERWTPVGELLRVLAVGALARAIIETARPVLLGLGHSRADLTLKATQAALMVFLVLLGGPTFGAIGVAWAVAFAAVATLPAWALLLVRVGGLAAADLARPAIAPLVATGVASAAAVALGSGDGGWLDVLSRAGVLAVAYVGATLLLVRAMPWSGLAVARRAFA